jgi:hypothetical protein
MLSNAQLLTLVIIVTPLIPALKQLAALTPANGIANKFTLLAPILATAKNTKTQ